MFNDELSQRIAQVRSASLGDLLRRLAARAPDRTATVYRDLRPTYAELDDTVNRAAGALAARGVRKGDRIALLSHNNHAYVVVHFALARLGDVSVPINFMLPAAEVAYVLDHSGTTGLVVKDSLVPVAEQALNEAGLTGAVTICGAIRDNGLRTPVGWESVEDWMAYDDSPAPDVFVADEELAQLMYTSGTESRPKGAMLSARSLIAQYVTCAVDGEMSADDIEIHALPLFHCAQLHAFLTPGIYLGATNVVLPGPDAATILRTVEEERATKLFCPPTVWISLLRHHDKEIGERLPGVRLFNFYGQTEMSPLATVLKPEDQIRKAGSAGRHGLNVETLVIDESNLPVPPGQVGEIVHRNPHAMLGYWNDPERTEAAFAGGWFQWRPRSDGHRGLPHRRRPEEGHDQDGWRKRRGPGGRGSALPAPGRGRSRRLRPAAPAVGRSGHRGRRPTGRSRSDSQGTHRPLPAEPGRLQVTQTH